MRKPSIYQKLCILLALILYFINSLPLYVHSSQPRLSVLHEQKSQQIISKGVVYETSRRLTNEGWLDIHVLRVDLAEPTVRINVLESQGENGLRETTQSLVSSNGAIAGINGDFFDMSRNPTAALGMVLNNSKLGSMYNYHNSDDKKLMSTLFIDNNRNPFIEFLKTRMFFYNEDNVHIEIGSVNKTSSLVRAVYIDRSAMSSTEQLDKRFEHLYKIVVENDVVTYISKRGETVNVPENGYVIVMNEPVAIQKRASFKVGQKVTFDLQTTVDLQSIDFAIGGGAKILENGKTPVQAGNVISGNQRHSRSAVGISKDKKQLILMVVDGRSHSIGATQLEMASLLLEYGAYDAMHLDGGGSSTMVGRQLGQSNINLYNTPSDGSQRRVVNALGIFSDAPKGKLFGLEIKLENDRVFQNSGTKFVVRGYDEFYNPVDIPWGRVNWEFSGMYGNWKENTFYPTSIGEGKITATVDGVKETVSLISMKPPVALQISPKVLNVGYGETMKIDIVGVSEDGYKRPINPNTLNWNIDKDLGTIRDGAFIAGNTTAEGLIEISMGNIKAYSYVTVGGQNELLESFESSRKISTSTSPTQNIEAFVTYNSNTVYQGKQSIQLDYKFAVNESQTQAAYIDFIDRISIKGEPIAIGAWIHGDNSKHWLRGAVVDSKGKSHNITFAQHINWNGWKYVQASLPQDISYPISLSRIYPVTLSSNVEQTNRIFVDEISAVYPTKKDAISLPQDTRYIDPMRRNLSTSIENEAFDITVFGTTSGKSTLLEEIVQREVLKQMEGSSQLGVFVGQTDISDKKMRIPTIQWQDKYSVEDFKNARVISLATSKGSMRTTDPQQWINLSRDLENATQDHLMLLLNKNIWDSRSFTDSLEAQLLHQILRDYKDKTGKNVLVISSLGLDSNVRVEEGIRYITLNGLRYSQNFNLHNQFSILRIRIDGKNLYYDLESVYKNKQSK